MPSTRDGYRIFSQNGVIAEPATGAVGAACAAVAAAPTRSRFLPYIWPEDDLQMKRETRSRFPLLVALVMCIAFSVVYLVR